MFYSSTSSKSTSTSSPASVYNQRTPKINTKCSKFKAHFTACLHTGSMHYLVWMKRHNLHLLQSKSPFALYLPQFHTTLSTNWIIRISIIAIELCTWYCKNFVQIPFMIGNVFGDQARIKYWKQHFCPFFPVSLRIKYYIKLDVVRERRGRRGFNAVNLLFIYSFRSFPL